MRLSEHLIENVGKFECFHTNNLYPFLEGGLSVPFYRALSAPFYMALSAPFYRAISMPFYSALSAPFYRARSCQFYSPLHLIAFYCAYFMCLSTLLLVLNLFYKAVLL